MELKDLYNLGNQYGREMELYGKSLYWSSPQRYEDTTDKLKQNEIYLNATPQYKNLLLEYGHLRKVYGIGAYQERGYAAEIYYKYSFNGFPNFKAFAEKSLLELEKSE